jgi:hypothetical protein
MRAGIGGTVGAVVVVVVTVDAPAASCCNPAATSVPRGGSVAAATLPSDRGALDERRLVGTDASNLSALAGVREGTVGATHANKNTRSISGPSKSGAPGENVT